MYTFVGRTVVLGGLDGGGSRRLAGRRVDQRARELIQPVRVVKVWFEEEVGCGGCGWVEDSQCLVSFVVVAGVTAAAAPTV